MDLAQQWVARAVEIDPDDPLVLYNVACIYAQLGENEKALDNLERWVGGGVAVLNWLKNDPYFDPLHKEPRYVALLQGIADAGDPPLSDEQPSAEA